MTNVIIGLLSEIDPVIAALAPQPGDALSVKFYGKNLLYVMRANFSIHSLCMHIFKGWH